MALCARPALLAGDGPGDDGLRPAPLQSRITHVQPMTGIVLWHDSDQAASAPIQLEFAYLRYDDVATRRGEYDWGAVERVLAPIARRRHQAILRFHDTYPGRPTTIPAYIKALPDYRERTAESEGLPTGFPDWSHPELQRFLLEFYGRFAARYDRDPRLAFVETGFGLWAEYHIYDGPMILGETFPDHAYQERFLRHLATAFRETPWLISIDAANGEVSPLAARRALLDLPYGTFDDSLLCREHAEVNRLNWAFFGGDRYLRAPAGGELSYASEHDQAEALAPAGPHGVPFEAAARAFHLSFVIGNDQPNHRPPERLLEAGMACGYRLQIVAFRTGPQASRLTITNAGVAPMYADAYVAVNGVRAPGSLKGLAPGRSREFSVPSGGAAPTVAIECDRLVAGQQIEYEADLP
ncbi:MAG: DUF4832 domain-containing protein [Planctomycetes bacterium]|nr:DUF4832 domain-containing protein [Planctomycetota bacterium]